MDPLAWFSDLWDWAVMLPADFAFLLALPFVVAAVALLRDVVVSRWKKLMKQEEERPRAVRSSRN